MRVFLLLICWIPGLLGAKGLDHAIISIYAVSDGKVVIDQNSQIALTPASCLKILTTAAALHFLGPDYRFETKLEHDGFIDDVNTLQGNIYIRGGGDPTLGSGRGLSPSWKKQLEEWVDAIAKLGIQKIKGTIIGDASCWERALAPSSWLWEDLGNYYGAGASALSFHENNYSLCFKPSIVIGERATILYTDPPLDHITFENEVLTGPPGSGDKACIYGAEFSSHLFVRGTIPAGVDHFIIKGSIPDSASYAAQLLIRELEEKGIVVEKAEIATKNERVPFHTRLSPPLSEIIYWTNHKSINLYAEHLLKKIGELLYQEGSTKAGTQALMHFLQEQKIDTGGLHLADGSGLSRKNLLTTKQLVAVLSKMKETDFPLFYNSLPLKEALIRGKSGSFSSARGYAGYAGDLIFAILINNCPDSQLMQEKIDSIIKELINFENK